MVPSNLRNSQDKPAAPIGLDQAFPGSEAMEWEV